MWLKSAPADLPFMFPGLRFIVGACGTKFGKTYGCATRITKEAWENQGSLNWWVSPSYSQAEMAMEEVQKRLPPGMFDPKLAKHKIQVFNPDGSHRSWIEFKSAEDPNLLRGAAVNFFVVDEAARGMSWESMKSVLTTVTQTFGRGIVISTPNGRGWFYDIYQRGSVLRSEFPEWYALRMPTWVNPHVSIQAILDAQKNLPAAEFRQEYAAEFLEESAGVFNNIRGCVRGMLQGYNPAHSYVMGVDLARLHDFTVLTVVDKTTKQVVAWKRFNQIDWQSQYFQIIALARQYHATVVIDSTGIGDPIVETLRGAGLMLEPYKIGTNIAKKQLIDNLRVHIEQGRISYPPLPVLIDELERYQSHQTASGVIQYSAPEGKHDDAVISLALAAWRVVEEPFIYRYYNVRGI